MFILKIDAAKIIGPENNKGISQGAQNPDSVLLNSMSRTHPIPIPGPSPFPPGGSVPPNPAIPPGMLLGKIMDLSNEYIIYALEHQMIRKDDKAMVSAPWENSNELFDSLSKYTGVPADSEKIRNVKGFFYSIMNNILEDPSNDGKQDYNDVLSIWKDPGNSKPKFPFDPIEIDFDNDEYLDYLITNNKIFKNNPLGTKPGAVEVHSIPGVDLQCLSDKVKQAVEDSYHPGPSVGQSFEFYDDINGDGKIDHIHGENIF